MKFNFLFLLALLVSSCLAKKNSTIEKLTKPSLNYDRALIPIPSDSKREAGKYKISEALLMGDFIFITVEPLDLFNAFIYDIIELPVNSTSTTLKTRLMVIQTEDFSKLDDSKPVRNPKDTTNVLKFVLKV